MKRLAGSVRRGLWVTALPLLLGMGCAGGWRNAPAGAGGAAGEAAIPGGATATPAPAGSASGPQEVAFTYEGEAQSVSLAGDFNQWNTGADPLTKQADGTWKIVKSLEPGRYEYKFHVDGAKWIEDPKAKESKSDPYGGKNSIVVVGGPAAAAAPAGDAPATGAPATGGQAAGAGVPPRATAEGVVFTYVGAASAVALAGEFNAWSTTTDMMTRQADGTWSIVQKLDPGTYSYKYLVDGTRWVADPANPETKDDGFGGKNSVVTVK